jgi:ubiquinone/menaquinone biosynthesis C-methylase UbiE
LLVAAPQVITMASSRLQESSGLMINRMTSETFAAATTTPIGATAHDWREAGEAWGHAATDWACFYEHYATDVVAAIFDRLALRAGMELLDVACGSGLAMYRADAFGAAVSGLDASNELLTIARARVPHADIRLGSMFELPWADGSFDAVVSINGIWGGCASALDEAFRVLRPGGRIGMSFWGAGRPLDLRECFKVFARHAPEQHFGSMRRLNNISVPGVAEEMLESSGFEVLERGQRISMIEWPDADTAWRALASVGPAVPALRHGDVAALRSDVLAAIAPCRDECGIFRFRNDHQFVIATKACATS